jgi:hypothetical protein
MNYRFSGPGAQSPKRGDSVKGGVYIPSCIPGGKPLADYQFGGEFIGESADGFMTRPVWRSDGGKLETIITRELWSCT